MESQGGLHWTTIGVILSILIPGTRKIASFMFEVILWFVSLSYILVYMWMAYTIRTNAAHYHVYDRCSNDNMHMTNAVLVI